MKGNFQLIVTFGPAINNEKMLRKITGAGVRLFRVNGAHASKRSIASFRQRIKRLNPKAKVLLDLPGNKIRTQGLPHSIELKAGRTFTLSSRMVNHGAFLENVRVGDMIYAHDSLLAFEVVKKTDGSVVFLSHSDGLLKDGKGLHRGGLTDGVDFLTAHDRKLLNMAKELRLDCVGVSYARNSRDIKDVRRYISTGGFVPEMFIKIETLRILDDLKNVFCEGDNFILDRGDLSGEIGIENISHAQETVIDRAGEYGKNIFLATQFLKNMVHSPVPLIAEVNDLSHVLEKRISGIQLSDETAVGRYPLECIKLVTKLKTRYLGRSGRKDRTIC